jgi:hypothetical protein
MKEVYENQYQKVKYAYNLIDPQMWANYKLLGIKDLAEQKLYTKAKNNLIKVFKVRNEHDKAETALNKAKLRDAKNAAIKGSLEIQPSIIEVSD